MGADYYIADTENGDHIDDPSKDALSMLMQDLAHPDNTFITITPAQESQAWYASVSLLDDGGYEVETRDPRYREHDLAVTTDPSKIAQNLTLWLARRHNPSPPAKNSDF